MGFERGLKARPLAGDLLFGAAELVAAGSLGSIDDCGDLGVFLVEDSAQQKDRPFQAWRVLEVQLARHQWQLVDPQRWRQRARP